VIKAHGLPHGCLFNQPESQKNEQSSAPVAERESRSIGPESGSERQHKRSGDQDTNLADYHLRYQNRRVAHLNRGQKKTDTDSLKNLLSLFQLP
jgi:hypothetical protein